MPLAEFRPKLIPESLWSSIALRLPAGSQIERKLDRDIRAPWESKLLIDAGSRYAKCI